MPRYGAAASRALYERSGGGASSSKGELSGQVGSGLQVVGTATMLANPAVGVGLFIAGSLLSAFGAGESRKRRRKERKKFMAWQNQQRVRGEQESLKRHATLRGEMGSATRSYFGSDSPDATTEWEGGE